MLTWQKPKVVWAMVILALVFAAISLSFGLYVLAFTPLGGLGLILGFVAIAFGIIDLIAAVYYWKTGRLGWLIFLLGPVIFFPFGAGIPTLGLVEPFAIFIFMFMLMVVFVIVSIGIFFWMTRWGLEHAMPTLRCRTCGTIIPSGYQYCPFCGTKTRD
ncbi:MAG: hypothetical protein QXW18_05130 [Candidatus Bathyarchaeia archaeon]